MPAIITDSFDYNDIVRVLDLDEAFVHHQIDALQPKYWRIVIKTKPKGFMYLDSNPLAKPEKAFFTPHFFDRYRERTGLPAYSGDTRSPIPVISVHSVGNLQYRRQS